MEDRPLGGVAAIRCQPMPEPESMHAIRPLYQNI